MSIIIRLQNLPLSAKSGDIRQFFGGLNIPNGGVHIIGGEKGDAFIVFTSDEDARVAMRLDGKRILENKVKLYLSSQMEMHHEIGRITKKIVSPSRQISPIRRQRSSKSPLPEREAYYDKRGYKVPASGGKRDFPPYSRPRTRSRSPKRYKSPRISRSPRKSRSPRRYSRSPRRYSRSPRRYSRSPRRRSRSPRRPSRSPRRYSRSPRSYSRSPKKLSKSPGRMSRLSDLSSLNRSRHKSPVTKDFNDSNFSIEADTRSSEDANLMKLKKLFGLECAPKEVFDWQNEEPKRREESLFEKKIAEVLASGLSSLGKLQDPCHTPMTSSVSELNKPAVSQLFNSLSSNLMSQTSSIHDMNSADDNHLRLPQFLSTPSMSTTDSYVPNTQPLQYGMGAPPSAALSPSESTTTRKPSLPKTKEPPVSVTPSLTLAEKYHRCLFVTFSGLKPGWDYAIVRVMLQGVFVSKNNIRYERDVHGKHTGTIIVKFCNRDDYKEVLRFPSYYFKKRVIHVSECPESVFRKYFDIPSKNLEDYKRIVRYVRIKGLHYDVTSEQVLSFFEGLEVVDLYIVYAKYSHGYIIEGKALGIAFVGFGNGADYKKAFSKDGELFLNTNRTIHFMKATKQKMLVAKYRNRDMLTQSRTLIPACLPKGLSISDLPEKRPLCVFVTGLPENISRHPVVNFFIDKGAKPSFVYLPVDDKGKKTIGRAFIAFDSLLEFDIAQQCHGTKMGNNLIFVKQILHDEMMNSLPEYEKHLHIRQLLEKVRKPVLSKGMHPKHMDFKGSSSKRKIPSKRGSFHTFDDDSDSRDSVQFLGMHSDDRSRSPIYRDEYYGRSLSPELSERNKKFDRTEKVTNIAANLDAKIQKVMYRSAKIENTLGQVKQRIQREKAMLAASEMVVKVRSPKPKYALESSPRPKEKRSSRWSLDNRRTLSPEPSFTRKVSVRSDREHSPIDGSLIANFKKNPRKRYGIGYRSGSPEVLDIDRRGSPPRKVRRAPSPGPSRKHEDYPDHGPSYHDEKHEEQQEAVVQLCHVDPTVGSSELQDFLIGFTIDINKIVRRVTDRGTCTGDVRVTFESLRDAERAVRLLNGSYINGTSIEMFVVE